MTAALKAISGSLAAPGITFNGDLTSGLYLSSSGIPGFVAHSLGMLLNTQIFQATAATVQAGGSNYAVGDTITLTGGTAVTQPVLTVATLTGTAVATATVTYPGFLTATASNPVAQGSTDGLGSGATFNLTYNNPAGADYRALFTDQAGGLLWQKLGASSFVSGLMKLANGKDFVAGIGASNVAAALGLSAPPPSGSFKNLAIKVASNTTATIAADFAVTTNGTAFQTTALSGTINLGTTGAFALDTGTIAANTWYAIWAIAKPDGTTAGLASTSFTAPTMPSGYTYKARYGAVRTATGSAQLMGTWQFGRESQYVVGLAQTTATNIMASGAVGNVSAPTWVSVSVATFVPPTSCRITVSGAVQTAASQLMIAPNNSYGAFNSTTNPPPLNAISPTGTVANTYGPLLLESSNIFWASTGAANLLICHGWEDNL